MPQRRGTPEGITIGFLGTGEMDVDGGMLLIQEYLDSQVKQTESVRWIFPLYEGEISETLIEYVAMAKASDIVYEVITRPNDPARRAQNEVISDAAKTYTVEDPILQLEQILKEAPKSALFVLWDKQRDGDEQGEIFSTFMDAGLDVRDLSDGLVPMSFETPEEGEQVMSDGAQGQEVEEEGEEELEIFARSDLEKMSMDDLKEIGAQLGVPPKKTRQAMVNLILEAQGGSEATTEVAVVAQEAPAAVAVVETAVDITGSLVAFRDALEEWSDRLSSRFNDFLNRLDKIEIKVATTPSAAEPEPAAPPARRLIRRG